MRHARPCVVSGAPVRRVSRRLTPVSAPTHHIKPEKQAFQRERSRAEKPLDNNRGPASRHKPSGDLFFELMAFFEDGDRVNFYRLYDACIPTQYRLTDPDAQKVEFWLQIYFAVFPALPSAGGKKGLREGVSLKPSAIPSGGVDLSVRCLMPRMECSQQVLPLKTRD